MAFAPQAWLRLAILTVLVLVWMLPVALGQAFTPATSYSTGSSSNPQAVAIADVNADGKPDIITANYISNSVGVLPGNGNGTFQTGVSYSVSITSSPCAVAVADVNADDKLDIITANYNSASAGVLLGNGNGTFQPAVSYLMGTGFPTGVAVADVSGDGKPDIVL
nr:hypothetical protein [Tanacetum cinerariifolium]